MIVVAVPAITAMAKNTLGDDDGIVDKHSDRQHQAHHREDVERQTGEIERTQGDEQRERDRGNNDERGRDLAQEQVQDDDREQTAEQAGVEQVVQRFAYAVAGVVERKYVDAFHLRQLADFFNLGDYPVRHVDKVGPGRLVDAQADRVGAIEMATVFTVGSPQFDFGNVSEPQSIGVDDQVANLINRAELTTWPDAQTLVARCQSPGVHSKIAARQQVP
jgi:hypothetical protein